MLLTIYEGGSEIATTSVFDCHLSPVRRLMAIKNSVSYYFMVYMDKKAIAYELMLRFLFSFFE